MDYELFKSIKTDDKKKNDKKKDNKKDDEKDKTMYTIKTEEPIPEPSSVVYVIPEEKPYEHEIKEIDFDKYPLYFEMPKIIITRPPSASATPSK